VAQTLVLMKSTGSADQLQRLQAEGLLRASAAVMSGCYAAFGLAEGVTTRQLVSATEGCNPPYSMNCTLAELLAWLNKVSGAMPMENIAFALLTVEAGKLTAYGDRVRSLGLESLDGAYVAVGRLSGCGAQNVLVEVMADDGDRMLDLLDSLTSADGVIDVQVLRVDPRDTRGFGSQGSGTL